MAQLKLFSTKAEGETYASSMSASDLPFVGYAVDTGECLIGSTLSSLRWYKGEPHVCEGGDGINPINDSSLNACSYGIYWYDDDIVFSPHNITAVGDDYESLPIHTLLKRVDYVNSTDITELPENDASTSTINGTVMVRIPHFYGRSWKYQDVDGRIANVVRISLNPTVDVESWQEIPECYINAWPVVNNETGKYQTGISLSEARIAAGEDRVVLYYELYKWVFYWLPVIEFLTFDTTREYTWNSTDSKWTTTLTNGVSETKIVGDPDTLAVGDVFTISGSMGAGLVNASSGTYNITTPGTTLCLGNRTGKVVLETSGHTILPGPVCAYSWRGFENVCGDIYTWLDGFITGPDTKVYLANSIDTLKTDLSSVTEDNFDAITCAERSLNILPQQFMSLINLQYPVTIGFNLGTAGDIIADNTIGAGMDSFTNFVLEDGSAIGMSDILITAPMELTGAPSACGVGSSGDAATNGAAAVASCGPGFLYAGGYGLSGSGSYVGFRTVAFSNN